MSTELHTVWQGLELAVKRNDQEIDRIVADDIQRVILVYRGAGDTPGDMVFAIVETSADAFVLPAESGIAGRIHFERQAFWGQRNCVYWVSETQAALPRRFSRGMWPFRQRAAYARVPKAELSGLIDSWPLQGPQTWDQRKWERIAKSRLLAPLDQAPRLSRPPKTPQA